MIGRQRLTGGFFLLGLTAAALSACAPSVPPGHQAAISYPAGAARAIFVSRGETVYDVARRYNVPIRDLIDLNGLQPPYRLRAGQRLILPVPREYTVVAGDTIYGLSRRFEVEMAELIRLNALSSPYMIRVGQVLRLPGSRGGPPAGTRMASAEPPPPPGRKPENAPVDIAPTPPRATSARVETAELAPLPGTDTAPATTAPVRPPAATAPPVRTAPVQTAPVQTAPVQTAPARTGSIQSVPLAPPAQQQAAAPLPAPTPVQPAAKPANPAVTTPPGPRQDGRFLWPVQGPILSEFGPKPGGLYNDGINIGAEQGTPVQAAENGVVVYAGNELKGYGNLILVRHADGWLTAYAHLDRMEVDRGAQVARGQRIGTVGRTGNVRTPQLHFGIRRNEKAIDPRDHLGGAGM